MRSVCTVSESLGASIMIAVSLWGGFSYAGAMKDGPVPMGSAHSEITGPSVLEGGGEVERKQTPSALPAGESAMVLRTIPSLSAQVSVSGLRVVPYVAAGFGGGYITELDRALHAVPLISSVPPSTALGLRNFFGPHLIPNEVHLGVRVPF
ncbi:MAG: hypothetical protein HP495_01430 [Nitrospira sp.]|uniref:hypothetical protein n=1 Tax=Nitrospira cf. moscoviensis SBR1015 TaxID=96242 RepID=UPI00117F7083|nr:hypothetical protein [Nitrospira cf. moscoviensis SBR1015]MBH0207196.1 hypothetical protein [Nitrospira sp.]